MVDMVDVICFKSTLHVQLIQQCWASTAHALYKIVLPYEFVLVFQPVYMNDTGSGK